MKTKLLFPHTYRMYGWVMLIPFLVLGIASIHSDYTFEFLTVKLPFYYGEQIPGNLTDEIIALGLIVSLFFIGFSKERIEDEQIAQLRMDSLQWSVYFNYFILAAAIIFIHGLYFFSAMVYNMFTLLIFFIIRFRWAIYRENRLLISQGSHEE